jgi:hypothetical protein
VAVTERVLVPLSDPLRVTVALCEAEPFCEPEPLRLPVALDECVPVCEPVRLLLLVALVEGVPVCDGDAVGVFVELDVTLEEAVALELPVPELLPVPVAEALPEPVSELVALEDGMAVPGALSVPVSLLLLVDELLGVLVSLELGVALADQVPVELELTVVVELPVPVRVDVSLVVPLGDAVALSDAVRLREGVCDAEAVAVGDREMSVALALDDGVIDAVGLTVQGSRLMPRWKTGTPASTRGAAWWWSPASASVPGVARASQRTTSRGSDEMSTPDPVTGAGTSCVTLPYKIHVPGSSDGRNCMLKPEQPGAWQHARRHITASSAYAYTPSTVPSSV